MLPPAGPTIGQPEANHPRPMARRVPGNERFGDAQLVAILRIQGRGDSRQAPAIQPYPQPGVGRVGRLLHIARKSFGTASSSLRCTNNTTRSADDAYKPQDGHMSYQQVDDRNGNNAAA